MGRSSLCVYRKGKSIKNGIIDDIKQKYSVEDELCSLRKEIETLKKGLMKMGKQLGVKASKKSARFLTEERDTEHGVFVKECVDKGRKRKQGPVTPAGCFKGDRSRYDRGSSATLQRPTDDPP